MRRQSGDLVTVCRQLIVLPVQPRRVHFLHEADEGPHRRRKFAFTGEDHMNINRGCGPFRQQVDEPLRLDLGRAQIALEDADPRAFQHKPVDR